MNKNVNHLLVGTGVIVNGALVEDGDRIAGFRHIERGARKQYVLRPRNHRTSDKQCFLTIQGRAGVFPLSTPFTDSEKLESGMSTMTGVALGRDIEALVVTSLTLASV